ncbi:hypothetical protein GQ607_006627 [Colletotrichum asianum]|uniref:Uncharacterized protein n=1 Tax=Colletotrichum asianum TaxID=702518 RepID=A0A8H3WFM6_9PEZI|nr:hypothetical protein GQ607_006627 [Colletotrichum asianum]
MYICQHRSTQFQSFFSLCDHSTCL